jgi:uncharacterized protein YehS (DUF1456 family)
VFKCDLDQTCQNFWCLRAVVNQESVIGPHGFKNTQKGTIECMMSMLGRHLLRGCRSYIRAEHLPTWVKKSPISRNSKKKKLGVAFKTDDICKVLNMNKVDLQRTEYENSGVYQD